MKNDYFHHPERFPKNAPGSFYTLGDIAKDGTWRGRCTSCGIPEAEAPSLLAPLTDLNSDTYFIRQPETDEEIAQACSAIEVCCVDALRYGGRDPKILARLHRTGCCDHSPHEERVNSRPNLQPSADSGSTLSSRKWWQFWK